MEQRTTAAAAAKTPAITTAQGGFLQRKCSCGTHTPGGGECSECARMRNRLQRKLAIGSSNDPLESEADRVADQVMATWPQPANDVAATANSIAKSIQRTSAASGNVDSPASVEQALVSPGRPLEAPLRDDMQRRFGHDFSQVRVHSDLAAAQSARDISAHAYTVGQSVVFAAGQYAPETHAGRRLIAHELTHIVQQAGGGVCVQADDDKGATKPAKPIDTKITFVIRAPEDAYTRDVTDYVKNTLDQKVVEVDNLQEAADYVSKYAKDNKTKITEIRLIAHGSTTGGIKMTPKGETSRRFVTAQELEQMAADGKLKALAGPAMAEGATVEFWGCYVGRSETTGKAMSSIFNADFKATDSTLLTSQGKFARLADKGEEGVTVNGQKVVEVRSTKEIDERVATGTKQGKGVGVAFNRWLVAQAKQMEADGDIPPQPDDATRITTMRSVFDRSGGVIRRIEIHSGDESVRRGDTQKWLKKWKTTKK
jgi:hypothetical protein